MRVLFTLLLCLACTGCERQKPATSLALASPPDAAPTRAEIFAVIEARATRYRMDPAFIYALVAAESSFNAAARNGDARGLLQLKQAAWQMVSSAPYEPTVWDWRANLEAGIDYLAYSRSYLHEKKVFSYPALLAAFHYGMGYVEERDFDLARLPVPDNEIYRQLWAGNLAPVPPPPRAP